MSHRRDPDLRDAWNVFDEVVSYTHALVGSHAVVNLRYVEDGRIGVFEVDPINSHARRIDVIAEQFLVVTVGDDGGRWELSYTDEGGVSARRVIAAVVAGNIEERQALGRSHVIVTLDDGEIVRQTGYSGCASLLVPQPGWTRWGRSIRYQPYRYS